MLGSGQIFAGRYEILRELGQGAFAIVYLAREVDLRREVAIKVLKEGRSDDRFIREAKLLSELRSPHTVTMLDFGWSDDRRPYMVFEYVPGETLETRLDRVGPMPAGRVAHITRQVLHSLAEAHDRGIVHRDVKPANIMMTHVDRDEDFVKVLDFGVAKPLEEMRDVSVELTVAGQIIGTMRYMAPEQLRGTRRAKPSSDVYAVGLIAYELLTHEKAASGDDSRFVIAQHLSEEPYRLPRGLGVPEPFQRAFEAMMEKDASHRPRDARQALRLLEEIHDDTTILDQRISDKMIGIDNAPQDMAVEERLEIDEEALESNRARTRKGTTDQVPQQQPHPQQESLNTVGRVLYVFAIVILTAGVLLLLATILSR